MEKHRGTYYPKTNEAKKGVRALNGIGPVRIDETGTELMPTFKQEGSMITMTETTSEEISQAGYSDKYYKKWL